jgi:CheY-like chemotaxis protein/anti-sigma regulatory factor (Ser/Thr protein kinase)
MATVLVVDDLATQRQLAGGLLKRAGYEVDFANNGKEALAKLAQRPADLVVTDLLMPEMDGLELLRAVRCLHPTIPVILMTAAGSEHLAVQALQEGAASYVPKQVVARRLAETVQRVLGSARAERTQAELGRRLTSQQLIFEVENDASLLLALPLYLIPHLAAVGLTDHLAVLRTRMALEEALVNALYHGNLELGTEVRAQNAEELFRLATKRSKESPYQERRIHICVSLTPERAEFKIRDQGQGFHLGSLPASADLAAMDRPHGRGIVLMRAFMDEVVFNDAGNMVTMTKRLKSAASSQNLNGPEPAIIPGNEGSP